MVLSEFGSDSESESDSWDAAECACDVGVPRGAGSEFEIAVARGMLMDSCDVRR